jgi:hypothetical protein
MNMKTQNANVQNANTLQTHRQRNGRCGDRTSRGCRIGLDSFSRLDAQEQNAAEFRDLDSPMQFHPYDVDAHAHRFVFLVEGQPSGGHSQSTESLANRHRSQGHNRRIRNTSRPERFFHRHDAVYRSGQALVELAFLIPLLVILIGATISFGLFFYQANTLQQAVDVAAMEISRFPLSPTGELGLGDLDATSSSVMYDTDFTSQIYDEKYLVIHDTEWDASTSFNGNFRAFVDQLPLLNRLLAQVMVRDNTYSVGNNSNTAVTRFPGAVVMNQQSGEETVLIPMLTYNQATGAETLVRFVSPIEEIRIDHDNNPTTKMVGPFSLQKPIGFVDLSVERSFPTGVVALRINYPAQSTTLVNRVGAEGEVIVDANDSSLNDGNTGTNYSLLVPAENGLADTTIHSGRFGLGRQAALLRSAGVRPYRKVMSVQAIYRREVFSE